MRITDNDTGGLFSSEWIALADVLSVIDERPTPDKSFNARMFASLFKSQSANTAGFLAAALKAENILVPFKAPKRLHYIGDVDSFKDSMRPLIDDNISLLDVVAERDAAKAKVRAENERKLKATRAKTAAKSK